MADNYVANAGSGGKTFASDEISGVDYPVGKIAHGADGSATLVSTASGLPVQAATGATFAVTDNGSTLSIDDGSGSITVDGTVAATQLGAWNVGTVTTVTTVGAITNPVKAHGVVAHNDALGDSTNPVLIGGYASTGAPSAVDADGDAVRAWFDQSGRLQVGDGGLTLSIDDGAGSITVDGTISAAQSGTWNVTNVSGTVSLPTGAATAAKQPALGTAGSASADVITVQGVASMTPLQVADNGGSLTVDGSVTANAGTNLNTSALALESGGNLAGAATSLAVLDDWDESDRAKVNLIVGQAGVAAGAGAVGATVQRVTLASDDPAVASLAILDDWDSSDACKVVGPAAHDAAVSGNPLLCGAEARTTNPTAVASGDAVRLQADTAGKLVVLAGATHDHDASGKATYTNTTAADVIAAAGAGVKIVVTNVLVTNAHATVGTKVEVRRGTTVIIQGYAAAVGGGFQMCNPRGVFVTAADEAVTARCVTTGADVDVFCSGYKIGN